MRFVCECNCVCGACEEEGCECECHMLDSLNNSQLQQLLIKHCDATVTDVYGKSRNELFRLVTSTDPELILNEGLKMIKASISAAQTTRSSTPIEFLQRIANGSSTPPPKKKIAKKVLTPRRTTKAKSKARCSRADA